MTMQQYKYSIGDMITIDNQIVLVLDSKRGDQILETYENDAIPRFLPSGDRFKFCFSVKGVVSDFFYLYVLLGDQKAWMLNHDDTEDSEQ